MSHEKMRDYIKAALREVVEADNQQEAQSQAERADRELKAAVVMAPVVEAAKVIKEEAQGLSELGIDITDKDVRWKDRSTSYWLSTTYDVSSLKVTESGVNYDRYSGQADPYERETKFEDAEAAIAFLIQELGTSIAQARRWQEKRGY